MRNEDTIRAEILQVMQSAQNTDSISEQSALTAKIKELNGELSDLLSMGADPCECGQVPMGMLKTPFFEKPNGETIGPVYEVGCIYCPAYLEGPPEREHRVSVSARGRTPEQAVERWNIRQFVTDSFVDRVPIGGEPPSPGRKVAQFDESGGWLSKFFKRV